VEAASGRLVIHSAVESDEGLWECVASNKHGEATAVARLHRIGQSTSMPLYNCLFIVLFYFVLLFNMHMFIVLILPACKWFAPFDVDVYINKKYYRQHHRNHCYFTAGIECTLPLPWLIWLSQVK